MKAKRINVMLYVTGMCLLVTGFAKLFSSMGNAGVLEMHDPMFGITFRRLFRIVGLVAMPFRNSHYLSWDASL